MWVISQRVLKFVLDYFNIGLEHTFWIKDLRANDYIRFAEVNKLGNHEIYANRPEPFFIGNENNTYFISTYNRHDFLSTQISEQVMIGMKACKEVYIHARHKLLPTYEFIDCESLTEIEKDNAVRFGKLPNSKTDWENLKEIMDSYKVSYDEKENISQQFVLIPMHSYKSFPAVCIDPFKLMYQVQKFTYSKRERPYIQAVVPEHFSYRDLLNIQNSLINKEVYAVPLSELNTKKDVKVNVELR